MSDRLSGVLAGPINSVNLKSTVILLYVLRKAFGYRGRDKIKYQQTARRSQFLGRRQRAQWESLEIEMERARWWEAQGKREKSRHLRKQILTEAYEAFGLDLEDHSPSILGPQFSSNIGHLAFAGAIKHAAKKGHLADIERIQVVQEVGANEVVSSLARAYRQEWGGRQGGRLKAATIALASYDNGPYLWPFLERIHTIKTTSGFTDLYDFLEYVGCVYPASRDDSVFELEDAYIEKASDRLQKLGLSPEEPFISIHLRDCRTREST